MNDDSFHVETIEKSLFDMLIHAAVLHDHYFYVNHTSMTRLRIHAVTNRVLTTPTRLRRFAGIMVYVKQLLYWTARSHLRKLAFCISLTGTHARSIMPRQSLPASEAPGVDVSLEFCSASHALEAALSLLLLVPVLIFVVQAGSRKRGRHDEAGLNLEEEKEDQSEQSTRALATPSVGGGVQINMSRALQR